MLNSIYYNLNKVMSKTRCYDAYEIICSGFYDDYDKLTRKKMVKEVIVQYIKDPNIINYIFNEDELEELYSLPKIVPANDFKKVIKYVHFFLYCNNDYSTDYTITLELEDVLAKAKEYYLKNKAEIEKEKEYLYASVGLFRVFGALKFKEYQTLLKKLNFNVCPQYDCYFKRFVKEDIYNVNTTNLALIDILDYCDEIIQTHPKDIYLNYNKEELMRIGKYYFDTKSPHYLNAVKYKEIKDFFDEDLSNEFIILAGYDLATPYFDYRLNSLFSDLSADGQAALKTLLSCLPKYELKKNQSNVLSEKDGILFYKFMMPFLDFLGKKYHIAFEYNGTQYSAMPANEIFEECIKDNFKYLDEYLAKPSLDEEAKSILANLKKRITGPFIVVKHVKEGTIFADNSNNLYLVKGIMSPIEDMQYLSDTPTACDTFIFQFKDSIIYSSIIIPYRIQLVGNAKKMFENLYKEKKDNIIKTLK